ncbi:hypothetical protein NPIL_363111, partial [Nephila pilipes]
DSSCFIVRHRSFHPLVFYALFKNCISLSSYLRIWMTIT